MKPNAKWNGDPEFELKIAGKADSDYAKDDYAKDPEKRRSISGHGALLNGSRRRVECKDA